jgi:CBS domain containing-hemolysin-like protein
VGPVLGLVVVLLLLAAHGVFVAGEFGLVAAPRERLERMAEEGDPKARLAVKALKVLSFQLSGAQLGITLTSLLVGFLVEATVAELLTPLVKALGASSTALAHGIAAGLALALASTTEMVLAELLPKNYAIARPLEATRRFVPPLWWFSRAFGPLIRLLNTLANWAVRRVGVEPREELRSVRSLEELELLIRTSGERGALDRDEATLLRRSIRLGHRTVADALVPRVDLLAIPYNATVEDLFAAARSSGHSRFPVYGQDIDDVVGIAHVIDGLTIPVHDRVSTAVSAIARAPYFTPVTRPLDDLLVDMKERGAEFAVAVDEYGGTDGIITLEDVVEELVGEIDDEFDPTTAAGPPSVVTVAESAWAVDGSLHLDEVADSTGFSAPQGDYETIAGFVLDRLGFIPDAGATLDYENWEVEVLRMEGRRIARLKLTRHDDTDEASP